MACVVASDVDPDPAGGRSFAIAVADCEGDRRLGRAAPGETDDPESRVGPAPAAAGATERSRSAIARTHAPASASPRGRPPPRETGSGARGIRGGTGSVGASCSRGWGWPRGSGNGTGVRCGAADGRHERAQAGAVLWTAVWWMVPPADPVTPLRSLSPWARAREDGRHGCDLPVPPRPAHFRRPDGGRHVVRRPVHRRRPGPGLRGLRDAVPEPGAPSGRPDAVADRWSAWRSWAVALVAPAALVLVGANRLARNLATARGRAPRRSSDAQGPRRAARRLHGRQRADPARRTRGCPSWSSAHSVPP